MTVQLLSLRSSLCKKQLAILNVQINFANPLKFILLMNSTLICSQLFEQFATIVLTGFYKVTTE